MNVRNCIVSIDTSNSMVSTPEDNGEGQALQGSPDDAKLAELLVQISKSLAQGLPSETVLQEIAQAACQALDSDIALIRTVSDDDRNFIIRAAEGPAGLSVHGMLGTYSVISDAILAADAGNILTFEIGEDDVDSLLSSNERWTFEQLGVNHLLIIPLFASGDLVGRLDIARTRDFPFESVTTRHALILSSQAATSLYTNRLETTNDKSQVFRTVLGLHQSIEQLADPHTILQAVVDLILREPGCSRCYAMLWNKDREEFVPTAVAGLEPHLIEMLKLITLSPQVVPAFDRMLHSSNPLVVEDATRSTLLPQSLVSALGIRAAMIVPLRGRHHQTIGFLLLDQSEPDMRFSERQVAIMEGIAGHLSTMIENAILYRDAVSSSDSLAVINEIGIQLAMLTDEESLFRHLHYQISSVVDATYFALGLLSADRSEINIRQAAEGSESNTTRLFVESSDPITRAITLGRGSLSGTRDSGNQSFLQFDIEGLEAAHSQMTAPITVGRNVIGAMTIQSPFRHAYGPEDLALFSAIALHTGVAIENARLYRVVQERGNRRAAVLDEFIQRHELERKELVDDIHNNTLQTLAACLYSLDRAHEIVFDSDELKGLDDELVTVRSHLSDNIDRLRKRIFQLRPATLDYLGLEPALRELLTVVEQELGLQGHLDVTLPRRLDPDVETLVYRITQDALSHIHVAGHATNVIVQLQSNERDVTITLQDKEAKLPAFDPDFGAENQETDVGLLALIERAELAGGNVRIARSVDAGCSMLITLPLGRSIEQHSGIQQNNGDSGQQDKLKNPTIAIRGSETRSA